MSKWHTLGWHIVTLHISYFSNLYLQLASITSLPFFTHSDYWTNLFLLHLICQLPLKYQCFLPIMSYLAWYLIFSYLYSTCHSIFNSSYIQLHPTTDHFLINLYTFIHHSKVCGFCFAWNAKPPSLCTETIFQDLAQTSVPL